MGIGSRINKQPEIGEYIQKLIPDKLDETIIYSGSIEFRFRQYVNIKGYTYPIPGVRTDKNLEYKIVTNSDLPFKSGDIIRFGRDNTRKYRIVGIDYSQEQASARTVRRKLLYPGDGNTSDYKIITLA